MALMLILLSQHYHLFINFKNDKIIGRLHDNSCGRPGFESKLSSDDQILEWVFLARCLSEKYTIFPHTVHRDVSSQSISWFQRIWQSETYYYQDDHSYSSPYSLGPLNLPGPPVRSRPEGVNKLLILLLHSACVSPGLQRLRAFLKGCINMSCSLAKHNGA